MKIDVSKSIGCIAQLPFRIVFVLLAKYRSNGLFFRDGRNRWRRLDVYELDKISCYLRHRTCQGCTCCEAAKRAKKARRARKKFLNARKALKEKKKLVAKSKLDANSEPWYPKN